MSYHTQKLELVQALLYRTGAFAASKPSPPENGPTSLPQTPPFPTKDTANSWGCHQNRSTVTTKVRCPRPPGRPAAAVQRPAAPAGTRMPGHRAQLQRRVPSCWTTCPAITPGIENKIRRQGFRHLVPEKPDTSAPADPAQLYREKTKNVNAKPPNHLW